MNIGIIGYGNIGELLFKNIVYNKNIDFNRLYISNRHIEKINHLKDIDEDIFITDSNRELVRNCEKIIICVETPDFADLIDEISDDLNDEKHVISCCAGFDGEFNSFTSVIPTISSTYTEDNPVKGVTLILHGSEVSARNRKYIEELFSAFSIVKNIENKNDLGIALIATSCMPAFISLAGDLLADMLSEKSGLDKKELFYMLNETMVASSELLKNSVFDSREMISKVATRNGITEKGISYLNEDLGSLYENLINSLCFGR